MAPKTTPAQAVKRLQAKREHSAAEAPCGIPSWPQQCASIAMATRGPVLVRLAPALFRKACDAAIQAIAAGETRKGLAQVFPVARARRHVRAT